MILYYTASCMNIVLCYFPYPFISVSHFLRVNSTKHDKINKNYYPFFCLLIKIYDKERKFRGGEGYMYICSINLQAQLQYNVGSFTAK